MSSRNLRKLKGKPIIAEEPDDSKAEEEEDVPDDLVNGAANRQTNLFSLLNDSGSADSDVKEDDDQDTTTSHQQPRPREPAATDSLRKKRRRKKRSARRPPPHSSGDNPTSEGDEVDASVRAVNRLLGEVPAAAAPLPAGAGGTGTGARTRDVLTVERRHLNPDAEMRRLFGREVVDQRRPTRRRGGGGHAGGTAHHAHAHVRQFSMVTNTHRFPPPAKLGLSMELAEQRGSELWFQYIHGSQYQQVEHQFIAAVDSVNPDNLLALLNRYPGHVAAALQLSEVCRLAEDLAMSAELVERALFSLEAAAHPLFSVTAGGCRLDYRRRENRPLFLAVWRQARALSERGCHRTALEFCKLLLSLQPADDPLGALLIVCHYALRAHEYNWLVRFYEQWEPSRNLSQLPSFAYSVPYARVMMAEGSTEPAEAENLRHQAEEELLRALLMFPTMYPCLLERCDASQPEEVAGCSLLQTSAENSQPDAVSVLCRLHAARSAELWRVAAPLQALQAAARSAAALVGAGDPRVERERLHRNRRYSGVPLAICRHVIISDCKEALGLLPREITARPVMGHDPLPPPDGTAGYSLSRRTRSQTAANPLASFFYSLLPNYDPNELEPQPRAEAAGGAEAAHTPEGGGAAELRTSVVSLLDAMRDLLTNLSPAQPEVDADAEADNSDDNAWDD